MHWYKNKSARPSSVELVAGLSEQSVVTAHRKLADPDSKELISECILFEKEISVMPDISCNGAHMGWRSVVVVQLLYEYITLFVNFTIGYYSNMSKTRTVVADIYIYIWQPKSIHNLTRVRFLVLNNQIKFSSPFDLIALSAYLRLAH